MQKNKIIERWRFFTFVGILQKKKTFLNQIQKTNNSGCRDIQPNDIPMTALKRVAVLQVECCPDECKNVDCD
jgi:hypothetical protein